MIMLRLCYVFFMEKKEGGENENFEKKKKNSQKWRNFDHVSEISVDENFSRQSFLPIR